MSSCPPPPGFNIGDAETEDDTEVVDTSDDIPMFKPPQVQEETYDPRVTDEETLFMLQQYLRPDQFSDQKVVKFILHYLTYRSNPDAAEAAGYPRSKGSYIRSRPEIHAVIEAITNKALMKYGYDASEMIERTKEIATLDPIEFQNPDGSFKTHMSQIDPQARRAIKKFKAKNIFGLDANGMQIVIGQLIEVEVWDKLKGIEMLGSEKNIFKKTTVVQHDVTSNMQSLLLESGRRADERKQLMREVGNGNGEIGDSDKNGRDGSGVPIAIGSGSQREDTTDVHFSTVPAGSGDIEGSESSI